MRSMSLCHRGPLRGALRPIGDKSLTHRALIFASIAQGSSRISGSNPGEDCRATASACRQLGASIEETADGWRIEGLAGRRSDPESILDLGNSGTGIRLLAGLVAGRSIYAVLTGDESLRRRPMRRIADPLRRMGATVLLRDEQFPPIAIRGGSLCGIEASLPVASAQVKSAILLASLGLSEGKTVVVEPGLSRDHTERFMEWLDLPIRRDGLRTEFGATDEVHGGFDFSVPADFSAATFFAVAGSLVEGSEIRLESVNLNPTRTGALDILMAMGANLEIEPIVTDQPEPIGTIQIHPSRLKGTVVGGDLLVRAIDEVPVLAVAAMMAEGETLFQDAHELRVKESDRIESTASLVRALGGEVETGEDWMRVRGTGQIAGGQVTAAGDHRIAMSAIVAGSAAQSPVSIDSVDAIATSDPSFLDAFSRLGAELG